MPKDREPQKNESTNHLDTRWQRWVAFVRSLFKGERKRSSLPYSDEPAYGFANFFESQPKVAEILGEIRDTLYNYQDTERERRLLNLLETALSLHDKTSDDAVLAKETIIDPIMQRKLERKRAIPARSAQYRELVKRHLNDMQGMVTSVDYIETLTYCQELLRELDQLIAADHTWPQELRSIRQNVLFLKQSVIANKTALLGRKK